MKPRRGDIWLVRFPFTDLASTKVRPALVLAVHREDIIFVGIFSRPHPSPLRRTWLRIPSSHPAFRRTGLKKSSVLKAEKLAVIHESVLVRRLGRLPPSLFREAQQLVKLALHLP